MKVHIYARDFPPCGSNFAGGLDKAVHGLAGGLSENGIQVSVICNGGETKRLRSTNGYDIYSFARPKHWGTQIPGELRSYIDACGESDVFLLNSVFNPTVYAMSRACIEKNIPYFCWPHDPYHSSLFAKRGFLKWTYWYLRERRMLRQAKGIQILSSNQERWLRDLGVDSPVIEMVNGYAAEDVLPQSKLQWREDGPPKLLFLGRIDYYNKALDVLLDSFAAVKGQTDASLTLQGPDWGDLAAMKARAQALGLGDRVRFNKPDFSRQASEILADHDVFLLPSRFEGFALASLEAMCAARVLMVSEVNGIAKYVKESGCGVVVTPDIESVKSGLLDLLSRRGQWKEMGMAGRDYALRNFRWHGIAEGVVERYAKLSGKRGELAGRQKNTAPAINV